MKASSQIVFALFFTFLLQVWLITLAMGQTPLSIPTSSPDSLYFQNIDEHQIPKSVSCDGAVHHFRYRFEYSELVSFDYYEENIPTELEDWEEEDILQFEEELNQKKAEELNKLAESDYNEDFRPLANVGEEELNRFLNKTFRNSKSPYCIDDCDDPLETCHLFHKSHYYEGSSEYHINIRKVYVDWMDDPPHQAEITADLHINYSGWVYFSIGCDCIPWDAYEDYALASVPPSPWNDINIVTPKMKTSFATTPLKSDKWIGEALKYTGGALVGGALSYWIFAGDEDDPDDTDPPPPATIANDQAIANCPGLLELNPLDNDRGESLHIVDLVSPYEVDLQIQDGQRIQVQIPAEAPPLIVIQYTAEDTYGRSYNGLISVQFNYTQLRAESIQLTGKAGEEFTGNLLTTAVGQQLTVSNLIPPDQGTVNWTSDGTFNYQSDPDFSGQVQIPFTIEDNCGEQIENTIQITLEKEEECEFESTWEVKDAFCGLEDGAIELTISPEDNYEFQWSDGANTQNRSKLSPGDYSVTITQSSSCRDTLEMSIAENPFQYITKITSEHGDCLEGGKITIDVSSPAVGPVIISVTGPGDSFELETDTNSTTRIHDFATLLPGEYKLSVYDAAAGANCATDTTLIIEDETPELIARDDQYNLLPAAEISGNLLANDEGLFITVVEFGDPASGELTIQKNGDFTYQSEMDPPPTVAVPYTIRDTCGNTAEGRITFLVTDCNLSLEFSNMPAQCGIADGSSRVNVSPPGIYLFNWSNGKTGVQVDSLSAGSYRVTVTDPETGCSISGETTISELPAEYVVDLWVEDALCGEEGEIFIDLRSPGASQYMMEVDHPGGTGELYFFDGDIIVLLSEFIDLQGGAYELTFTDLSLPQRCTQTVSTLLEESQAPEIVLEGAEPPSSPSASDGIAFFFMSQPTTPPYTIYVDGAPTGQVFDDFFAVEDLGEGTYIVQIVDENGCASNEVILNLEADISTVYFSSGHSSNSLSNGPEHPSILKSSAEYRLGWRGNQKWYPWAELSFINGNQPLLAQLSTNSGIGFRSPLGNGSWQLEAGGAWAPQVVLIPQNNQSAIHPIIRLRFQSPVFGKLEYFGLIQWLPASKMPPGIQLGLQFPLSNEDPNPLSWNAPF